MWRATLALVELNEAQFSRPLDSLRPQSVEFIIEFYASLNGIGLLWYKKGSDNCEISLGAAAVDLLWLDLVTDSSYQNVTEYMGGLVGLIGLLKLGISNVAVEFRGDSLTALSWAKNEKSKGTLVSNAAIVFSLLCIRFGLNVQDTTHISGDQNWRCDTLSRLAQEKLTISEAFEKIERTQTRVIDMNGSEFTSVLLRSCNPKMMLEKDEEFLFFWNEIQRALNGIESDMALHNQHK